MKPTSLEGESAWRGVIVTGVFALVLSPTVAMLVGSMQARSNEILRPSFQSALQNGIIIAAASVVIACAIGLPMGLLASRFQFSFRDIGLAAVALPLLVPSFLWAIGWSSILDLAPLAGTIISFSAPSISLVALTTLVSTRSLSGSQIEAALLAGGEWAVFKHTCRYVAVPAGCAAMLAGLLTLSDPGPGQIFGVPTAAGEMLTSFSAFYDFNLASRQCLMLAGLVLVAAIPLGLFVGPRIASEILVKQVRTASLSRHTLGRQLSFATVIMFCITFVAMPLFGLIQPVAVDAALGRALRELNRTAESTVLYAVGSGLVATILGLLFAAAVGRSERLKKIAVPLCFVLFAVPPAVTALAFVQAGTSAPQWADVAFRSRFAMTLAAGARLFPVAALIALRAWNSMPKTWALAGAIHGIPLMKYVRSVVLPVLAPSLVVSVVVCGLLATADVVTVLLVHPPGQSSLTLTIFTIMANAPQSLVAALCLIYVASAILILSGLWAFENRILR